MAGSRFKQAEDIDELKQKVETLATIVGGLEIAVADLKDGCHALLKLVAPIVQDWQACQDASKPLKLKVEKEN